jgi:hypothetical protein
MTGQRSRGGGRVAGVSAGVAAFVTVGVAPLVTMPPAHADIDDIFAPVIDAVFGDFGHDGGVEDSGYGLESFSAAETNPDTATVPLETHLGTEPVTHLSVNGGPETSVLVDTGSNGLVIPIWDMGLEHLSLPTELGTIAYSGGLNAVYLEFPATVDFGNGIETTDAAHIDAVLFTYPSDLWDLFTGHYPTSISEALGGAADGVLGVGPNSAGPDDVSVTEALPGHWGDGLLIDQSGGHLTFGSAADLTDGDWVRVDGAPIADLYVSFDGGDLEKVTADIDSGGVYGTIPSSLLGDSGELPSHMAVYDGNGADAHLLYSLDTGGAHAPAITDDHVMNTGNLPFALHPIYIDSAGDGATYFNISAAH